MRGRQHTLIGGAYASVAVLLFVVGLIGGHVCRQIPEWDLTQPQAVLIAAVAGGLVSGGFLIAAAWIAFHGQRQNREDERNRHDEMLTIQRQQHKDQLDAQREQFERELDEKERIRKSELRRAAALHQHRELAASYSRALQVAESLVFLIDGARHRYSKGDAAGGDLKLRETEALFMESTVINLVLAASTDAISAWADISRSMAAALAVFTDEEAAGNKLGPSNKRDEALGAVRHAIGRFQTCTRIELRSLSDTELD